MDLQIFLIILIVLLAIAIIAVGVYLVLVLRELRLTLVRVNDILEVTDKVFTSLSSPVIGLSTAFGAFTQGIKLFQKLKDISSTSDKEDNENE